MKGFKHPKGDIIKFQEYGHRYFIDNSPRSFISVTQFLNKYFPIFERDKIAKKYAKKRGLDWREVAEGWSEEGRTSSARGTKYHNFSEKLMQRFCKKEYAEPLFYDSLTKMMEKKLLGFYRTCTPYTPEYIVACLNHNIAGAIDLLFGYEDTLYIMDWKFVKEIKMLNYWQQALPPIQHMPDTNYYKYALQLNLYSYIIKTNNYFPQYPKHIMGIFHVTKSEIVDFKVPDLRQDIRNMLVNYACI